MNADRVAGGLLFLFALAYAAETLRMRVGITSDSLGPRAYPLLLATVLAIAALCLLFRRRPTMRVDWPEKGMMLVLASVIASLFVYSLLIVPLGFIASTTLQLALLCLLYGANWRQSLTAAVGVSLGIYALFDMALGIPLPAGYLFRA